ncbi:MAG: dTDP-4-dehydrorhamnose reductase [Selenomonadaceae bacterium]|nr:dTDP-4-dehydrorhamnose reductase [Selenomonadaceae bacterium]
MKVLVTGVTGQLGFDVCRVLKSENIEVFEAGRKDFSLTDYQKMREVVLGFKPDVIIHAAAYTAVDKAEEESEIAFAVNGEGTRNLAKIAQELDAKFVYIGTDYVFPGDGDNFYETYDEKKPLNAYGKSKLMGEEAVKEILEKYFIVRISWVFGVNGKNFVKTMLRLAQTHEELRVVADQTGSPTYTYDLAKLLADMIKTNKYGVYHATNEGICSWAEFAEEIFKLAGKNTKVIPIKTEEYPTPAARPKNSRLSKKSLDYNGFTRLPDWKDALKRYLREIGA